MSSASNRLPTPEGPGSVSGAPNLPAGFTDTFTSRYAEKAPEELLAAPTAFLAPYRDGSPAAHDAGPHAACV